MMQPRLTRSLRSSRITGLPCYYGAVRPSASPRYSRLAVFAAWASPLPSKRLVPAVPCESLCWCHAPYTPAAARPIIRLPAGWSQEIETLLVLTAVLWITTRHRRVHFRSSHQHAPARGCPRTFAPALTTTALNRSRLEWFGTRPW